MPSGHGQLHPFSTTDVSFWDKTFYETENKLGKLDSV